MSSSHTKLFQSPALQARTMETAALQLENRTLKIAACGNLLLAIIGCTAAGLSGSQAILLDGLFNLTYFATGLFTIRVARLVAGGDDERFPHGYAFFEPLVNGIKGMLVLGVSVLAAVGSVQALLTGGRPIAAGMAVIYGLVATSGCALLAWITSRGAKATGSPLVQADAENWLVNAAISGAVLLAFGGIFLLKAIGLESWVPYVDPVVVLTVVCISLFVPVRMAWQALMSLLNRAPEAAVVEEVSKIVDDCLAELPVIERFIRVIQPGRQRLVLVHAVLPEDYRVDSLRTLDEVRLKTHEALCRAHVATIIDLHFTADRRWGAPVSDGGAAGAM